MTDARNVPRGDAPGLAARIVAAAHGSETLPAFRLAALQAIREVVPFDGAFFHALSPRVPLETGVWLDLDLDVVRASARHWDQYAVDLARVRDRAMERGGVAVDVEVFGASELSRLAYSRELARPLGIGALMLVHLTMTRRIVSALGLARRSRSGFLPAESDLLRELAPVLALADVAHATGLEQRGVPIERLRCEDGRLTQRQRDLVEHVALGHTNEDIARALAISANTVRNQLAVVFKKLGAANRAEAVRLAVLR
jgi:DNA-binding CsgD family transcriptional regulator